MTLNILLKEMDTALLFFFPSLIFTQPFWYQSVPQSSTQLLKSPVDRVAYLVSKRAVKSKFNLSPFCIRKGKLNHKYPPL